MRWTSPSHIPTFYIPVSLKKRNGPVQVILFKLDEDVLIGVVYIPPEFPSYSSQEAFNDMDFDIRNFSRVLLSMLKGMFGCITKYAERDVWLYY